MKKIRRNQIILLALVLVVFGCMAHVTIRYNRVVDKLEGQTAKSVTMKRAHDNYRKKKAISASIGHGRFVPLQAFDSIAK